MRGLFLWTVAIFSISTAASAVVGKAPAVAEPSAAASANEEAAPVAEPSSAPSVNLVAMPVAKPSIASADCTSPQELTLCIGRNRERLRQPAAAREDCLPFTDSPQELTLCIRRNRDRLRQPVRPPVVPEGWRLPRWLR